MSDIDRGVVRIGLDFRPLPLDVGDGNVWHFEASPSPAQFDALVRGIRGFTTVGTALQGGDDASIVAVTDKVEAALLDLLVDQKERKAFPGKYGVGALVAIANAVIQEATGFQQPSPKRSGKG